MMTSKAVNAYQTNQTQSRAEVASPYQLVKIMFENLLDNLSKAAGAVERDDPAVRGECLGRAMDIISTLSGALDHEIGGEMSENLSALYEYSNRRLFDATRNNDVEAIDEVMDLMGKIKEAWDQLESQFHGAG